MSEYTYFVRMFQPGRFGVYRRESEFVAQRIADCDRRGEAMLVCACLNAHVGSFVDMHEEVMV